LRRAVKTVRLNRTMPSDFRVRTARSSRSFSPTTELCCPSARCSWKE
jgi:hypothetical protein